MLKVLLEVQESDTAADRLRHRRANLPERAELATTLARSSEVEARLRETDERRQEVLGRQAGVEASIGSASQRVKEIEGRLYSGQVSATKDILAMTAEVDSLNARRSKFEDELLGTMEEDEPLVAEELALQAVLADLTSQRVVLQAQIAEAEQAIDGELSVVAEARQERAALVADDLMATYEKLRKHLGGEGAVRLTGKSCAGCHLTLPAQELERIKRAPPDELLLCDQCGRILVR